MTAPQRQPDRAIELISILRRILLFAASQLEQWLARQGVYVRKPTHEDEDGDVH